MEELREGAAGLLGFQARWTRSLQVLGEEATAGGEERARQRPGCDGGTAPGAGIHGGRMSR